MQALQASFSGTSLLDSTGNRTFAALDQLAGKNPGAIAVENNAVYPNTAFGNQMKDLAALIKSGIGVEAASVDIGGWDTHSKTFDAHKNKLMPSLDGALSELFGGSAEARPTAQQVAAGTPSPETPGAAGRDALIQP